MKKVVFILFSIFMLASTISSAIAMDSDSGSEREEGVPQHNNQRWRVRENKREELKQAKREVERLKLQLSHLEEFKKEMVSAENNKHAYKNAKALAEQEGREAGVLAGVASGVGYGMLSLSYISIVDPKKGGNDTASCIGFMTENLWSNFFYCQAKKKYYDSLRANNTITTQQKIKLKKKYHKEEFKANTAATAITAVGVTASLLYGLSYLFPLDKVSSYKSALWNVAPYAAIGIAGLKYLTYTGTRSYKKWSRGY